MSTPNITLTPSEKLATKRRQDIEQKAKRNRAASVRIEMLNELAELRALNGDDGSVYSLSMLR